MRRSEIEFRAGSILRKEMLQDMYDYPRIAIESLYSDYSEGILYGLSWKINEDNHHIICPGALKFHGNIYFLKDEIDVESEIQDDLSVNGAYRLCFVYQDADKKIESKAEYCLKLMALQDKAYNEVKNIAYWYAYINYSGGKTIEIVKGTNSVKYGIAGLVAADDGFDFQLPNWLINQQLLKKIEEKKNKHPLDYQILREIYAGKPISCSFINVYLNELGEKKISNDCTPQDAINNLEKAIDRLVFKVSVNKEDDVTTPGGNTTPFRGGSL